MPTTPTDPLFVSQTQFSLLGDIQTIWDEFTGTGINVAIYDDGVDFVHEDLAANYDPSLHVVDGSGNPVVPAHALFTAANGTHYAGIIGAAANNGVGGAGVAFGATLTGVNIFDPALFGAFSGPEADFLNVLGQATGNFDIVTNGWSMSAQFTDSLNSSSSLADEMDAVYASTAEFGRGGLGTITLHAAGDGGLDMGSIAINQSRFVITVAGTDTLGQASFTSNHGAAVLVAAPGGGVTTDPTGDPGANNTDYDTIENTGGATAVVSGVVALMLEANPNLGWRDVQSILAASATFTGDGSTTTVGTNEDGTWTINDADLWNGGGMHHHVNYGYGMVNAYNAVRMAEVWSLFNPAQIGGNSTSITFSDSFPPLTVPSSGSIDSTFAIGASAQDVERVEVSLTFAASFVGDLAVTLTSAEGTVIQVYLGDSTNGSGTFDGTYTFAVEGFRGETRGGNWTVSITDQFGAADPITLTHVGVTIHNATAAQNDVHHITDEFLAMVALDPSRATLIDADGGTDWINMATIAGDVVLNLSGTEQFFVDGVAWGQLSGSGDAFDSAVTGDGNDSLTGNLFSNALHGMRGNDTLSGGFNRDSLFGGAGDDLIRVSRVDGLDDVFGGTGTDTLEFTADTGMVFDMAFQDYAAFSDVFDRSALQGVENILITGVTDDQIRHSISSANLLDGGGGNDTIFGGQGDTLRGGDGGDNITVSVGDSTVNGGAGRDILFGGGGNTLFLITGTDEADDIAGGAGTEMLDLSGASNGYTVDLANQNYFATSIPSFLYTIANVENVSGTALADSITGDILANRLEGGGGDDSLFGGEDADTLLGGLDTDTLFGGDGDDVLDGGIGNESIFGGEGDDTIIVQAGEGNDSLFGGTEVDTADFSDLSAFNLIVDLGALTWGDASVVFGTVDSIEDVIAANGADHLTGSGVANRLEGGGGADTLFGGGGIDTLFGDAGDDVLDAGVGSESVFGGLGNDMLIVGANEGSDSLFGGDDVDTADFSALTAFNLVVDLVGGTWGNSVIPALATLDGMEHVLASGGSDRITGSAEANRLEGNGGADTLSGGTGIDTLLGGEGDDTLNGGSDVDEVFGGNGNDRIIITGFDFADAVDGGADTDTLDLAGFTFGGYTVRLDQNQYFEIEIPATIYSIMNVENVIGTQFADILTGNGAGNRLEGGNGADSLTGGAGADSLRGDAGNDTLNSGTGSDTLTGGADNDTYLIASGTAVIEEAAGQGTADRLRAALSFTLAADDAIEIMETTDAAGTGTITLFGNGFVQAITGNAGVNTLGDGGGAGADVLTGLAGNDTYVIGNSGTTIVEAAGDGTLDTLRAGVNFTLAADDSIEVMQTANAAATAALALFGNGFAQAITGNAGGNTLGDGGGAGADTLTGLGGNDVYAVNNSATTIVEAAGGGTLDTLRAGVNFTLAADDSIEVMQTTNAAATAALALFGNGFAQAITGNAGGNTLGDGGGAGADTLTGLGGNDVYAVNNSGTTIVEAAGGGTQDTLRAGVNFTLAADDHIEIMQTTNAAGVAALALFGNAGVQAITGNAGGNTLGDGGGAGADTLTGLGGNDVYAINNAATTIVEVAGGGTADTVRAGVSFTLAADDNIEVMQTTNAAATGAINLTGNALAQAITGNAGINTLNDGGGAGADTLTGLRGNDLYVVNNAGTTLVEVAGGGTLDTLRVGVSFTLAADDHIEVMQTSNVAATGAFQLTGNALAQTITGNAGANVLSGEGGNDTLTGNGGADTFVFRTALGAANIDAITDFNVAADTIHLENAIFTGLAEGVVLNPNAFAANATGVATTATQRILYDTTTGNIFFDADGNGIGGRVQFADIAGGLALTHADFFII